MENDRDRLVVIIAGYSADIDRLLESNDGLRSRFATRIEFDSYSPEEIVEIAKVIANANDSTLSEEAAKSVLEAATLLSQRTLMVDKPALDIAGNGRYARQLVEKAGEQSREYEARPFGGFRQPRRRAAERNQRRGHGNGDRRRYSGRLNIGE